MVDYFLLVFLGTITLGCAIAVICCMVLIGAAIFDKSVDDAIVSFAFAMFIAFMTCMGFDITTITYTQIKEKQAHPCIQWSHNYDQGQLGQTCIKRKE